MNQKVMLNENVDEEIIMDILRERNLLVVTTKCNINCIFCSRKYNPFVSRLAHRRFSDIKAQINLFKPNKMIHINASISRLTDGEPFSHPRIWDILNYIRKKFPFKNSSLLWDKIKITTNGTYLIEENLRKLAFLKGISIVHSINCTNLDDWVYIHDSTKKLGEISINVPRIIKKYGLEYIASVVALPKLLGWDAIENTLKDLNSYGVKSARVHLPTYTKYASKEEQSLLKCDDSKFKELMNKLQKELKMSLLVHPFGFDNVDPQLQGYGDIGIKPTDEIISINNQKVFCRTHAVDLFREDKRLFIVKLKTEQGDERTMRLLSRKLNSCGYSKHMINKDIVFDIAIIENVTKNYKKILVMSSEAGEKVVRKAFQKAVEWSDSLKQKEFYYKTTYNDFYGGSVKCAGLLTCGDYKKYLEEFINKNFKPDLVLVSKDSFDLLGRDLLKDSIYDVAEELDTEIIPV